MTQADKTPAGVRAAAAEAAVLVDESARYAVLVVSGGDRRSWLNGLVTSDVTKLEPRAAQYGLAVSPKGRVVTDLFLVDDGERVLVLLPRGEATAVRDTFDHYLVMEDVELHLAEAFRIWSLTGPAALSVAAAAPAPARGVSSDGLGLGGALVVAPGGVAEATAAALTAAVTRAGGLVVDDAELETLRLARGVPRFGPDFGPQTYPQEAGLETSAVSFDKGCYLGQEVVCMLQMRGHVKRKLALLRVDGTVRGGDRVTTPDGQEVGQVTSASATLPSGAVAALAMLKLAATAPGTELVAGTCRARVETPPLA